MLHMLLHWHNGNSESVKVTAAHEAITGKCELPEKPRAKNRLEWHVLANLLHVLTGFATDCQVLLKMVK